MNKLTYFLKYFLDKPQILFVLIAFIFGLLFMIFTPPYEIPDENNHFYRTCDVADGVLYNAVPAKRTIYEEKINNIVNMQRNESVFNSISGYSAIMYIVPSVAVKITSAVSDNPKFIFYSGRFLNLLLYILLIYIAIKITPVFKYGFLFGSLLPMALWEGMSYSADSFCISFTFLFFAYLFRLIFQKEETIKKDLIIITVLSIIGAFCKGVVYPLILLFFIPPFAKDIKLKKLVYVILIILVSVGLCVLWRNINYVCYNAEVEIFPPKGIFLKAPFTVILRIIYSTFAVFNRHMIEFIGVFGWVTFWVIYPSFLPLFYSMYLGLMFILGEKINKNMRLTAIFTFLFFHFYLYLIMFYTWTDVREILIDGVQGRYYLPIFPLTFLIFSNKKFNFSERIKYIFKFIIILFLILLLMYCSRMLYGIYITLQLHTPGV